MSKNIHTENYSKIAKKVDTTLELPEICDMLSPVCRSQVSLHLNAIRADAESGTHIIPHYLIGSMGGVKRVDIAGPSQMAKDMSVGVVKAMVQESFTDFAIFVCIGWGVEGLSNEKWCAYMDKYGTISSHPKAHNVLHIMLETQSGNNCLIAPLKIAYPSKKRRKVTPSEWQDATMASGTFSGVMPRPMFH